MPTSIVILYGANNNLSKWSTGDSISKLSISCLRNRQLSLFHSVWIPIYCYSSTVLANVRGLVPLIDTRPGSLADDSLILSFGFQFYGGIWGVWRGERGIDFADVGGGVSSIVAVTILLVSPSAHLYKLCFHWAGKVAWEMRLSLLLNI